jgi:hypothetical protein
MSCFIYYDVINASNSSTVFHDIFFSERFLSSKEKISLNIIQMMVSKVAFYWIMFQFYMLDFQFSIWRLIKSRSMGYYMSNVTDNTMIKRKGQTMIYKTPYRKLRIDQHKQPQKSRWIQVLWPGWAVSILLAPRSCYCHMTRTTCDKQHVFTLVFCMEFYRSLFVLFFWSLYCLSFYDSPYLHLQHFLTLHVQFISWLR